MKKIAGFECQKKSVTDHRLFQHILIANSEPQRRILKGQPLSLGSRFMDPLYIYAQFLGRFA
jgi:hypothetical protein